jgi:hypothetical protein
VTICDKCGVELHISDYPFCPHGHGHTHVSGDECDYWDHNLGQQPIRIRSWSQRRALMAAQGLQDFQYDVEVPEGMAPNRQRPTRWGAYRQCDPEHLAWLASKLATGKAEKVDDDSQVAVTVHRGSAKRKSQESQWMRQTLAGMLKDGRR